MLSYSRVLANFVSIRYLIFIELALYVLLKYLNIEIYFYGLSPRYIWKDIFLQYLDYFLFREFFQDTFIYYHRLDIFIGLIIYFDQIEHIGRNQFERMQNTVFPLRAFLS